MGEFVESGSGLWAACAVCEPRRMATGITNLQANEVSAERRLPAGSNPLDLAFVTALAAVLMLYDLGGKPLAGDEATSYFIASLGWSDFWHSLTTSEANASLFYALLRIPIAFGTDPWVLRMVPAVAGVLTVPVLYVLLARLFDRRTALLGAGAVAVNAFFVAHTQDVRGYSMAALFATVATLLFVLCVESPTVGRLGLYVAVSVAGCYSHFFCGFVVAAHLLSVVFLPRGAIRWRRFTVTYVAIAISCVPLAYFILTNDRGQVDWILPTTGEIVLKNLYEFVGYGGRPLAIAVGIGVLLALARGVRTFRGHGRSQEAWSVGLILLWLLLPFVVTGAITIVKPLFIARYLLPALPGLGGAIAVGLAGLRWRPAFVAAGAAVLVLSAMELPEWYSAEKPDWAERADRVIRDAEPGDAAIFYSPTAIRPFGYYAGYYAERDDGKVAPPPVYPSIDWLGYSQSTYDPDLDVILDAAARRPRVWLITSYALDEERQRERKRLLETLQARCSRVRGYRGVVRLYEGCTA